MPNNQFVNYYHHTIRDVNEFDPSTFGIIPIEKVNIYGVYEGKKFLKHGNLARVGLHYPTQSYQIQKILELKRK